LTYGTAAAVLMVGALLYGLRRRAMKTASRFKLGRGQTWAQFHIYGGALCLLLALMHTGFRTPTGALTFWLWALTIWVCASGVLGVLLQKWIPQMLTSGLAVEVLQERIPELIGELKTKAEALIESCSHPMQEFYRNNIAAALVASQPRLIYYLDITGGIQARTKQFEYLRKLLSAEEKEKLAELELIYKTKLELDAHYTLQNALRWWLYLHVPVSIILLVLLGAHLFAVFYY
jgi:hypothetical protein